MLPLPEGEAERLFHVEQLDLELERGIGRDDVAGAARAVAERRRHDEDAFAADLHASHAFVPTLDDLATAERERERLTTVLGAVEPGAVHQPAGVVDDSRLAGHRRGAAADLLVGVLESILHGDLRCAALATRGQKDSGDTDEE